MKGLVLVASFWTVLSFSQILDGERADFLNPEQRLNAITDPSISRRCLRLLETRQDKLKSKQKLMALIERNQYLQQQAPKNKRMVIERLELSMRNLEREKTLMEMKIQHLEESLIRRGCPGVNIN